MAKESFISPVPDGAAREADWSITRRISASTALGVAGSTRSGQPYGGGIVGGSSNWGLGGTDTGTLVLNSTVGGGVYQVRGGIIVHEVTAPLMIVAPQFGQWRYGLHVHEFICAWPSDAVGADNGIIWGFTNTFANLRPSIGQCFALMNDTAGNLQFTMVGPVSTQVTNLPGLTLSRLNKFRIECRHATAVAAASVKVFVNDAGAPSISKLATDANFPAQGAGMNTHLYFGFASGSAVNYTHLYEWNVYFGPDTTIGM